MSYPPPWTGLTFTSKLHSTPSPELAHLKLPTPFVAVITGGSRNIGAATAKAFVHAGATGLILTATNLSEALLSTKKEIEDIAPSIKVTVLAADQSDPSTAGKIAEAVKNEHGGRLDALINNAAVVSTHPSAYSQNDIAAIQVDQLSTTMSVNLVGKFAIIKALLPLLLETDGGAKTIVNVTSALSHFASMQAMGYNLSQLATNRLTEAVAECYGNRDVLAFAVHPGIVATIPRPIGTPEGGDQMAVDDVGLCGGFLVWLLSEKKKWLSGRYLSANWDVDELEGKKEDIVKGDKLKVRMVT
ncbi:NAD(P)-binding protein [Lentithecium fluviatile CBS 122367]|uniref:NAD(P)-binding protein n=1 Tax=Lentithecium fluviatile CBS 122367 TaxID=1168545 RepID=A0A6G1JCS8_9PLEO|nr:NAD(P)-binding protein [Lentithecium fluviatile CBS 122367]